MGYACPVCGTPQRDGEHLANHLAFTAMLHADDHEAWLDERAPGWAEESPADLADRVVGAAEERAYEEVFEDTVHGPGGGHDHDHGRGRPDVDVGGAAGTGTGPGVPEDVLREARDLTRRMYDADGDDGVADADADE